jgi:hypothetical protein
MLAWAVYTVFFQLMVNIFKYRVDFYEELLTLSAFFCLFVRKVVCVI